MIVRVPVVAASRAVSFACCLVIERLLPAVITSLPTDVLRSKCSHHRCDRVAELAWSRGGLVESATVLSHAWNVTIVAAWGAELLGLPYKDASLARLRLSIPEAEVKSPSLEKAAIG